MFSLDIEVPPSIWFTPWFTSEYNNIKPTQKLLEAHQELGTVAFLIIKNDSLRHEQYFDGYGTASISNSFSMVKSMVAAKISLKRPS